MEDMNKKREDCVDETYGYSLDNPISVVSIGAAYFYLNMLRYNDRPIQFERIGSFSSSVADFVDGYEIFTEEGGETVKVATLYINSYAYEMSDKAPLGFTLF